MPVRKVKVKWGKEVYSDVQVNTDENPLLFKAQLFTLTGVQPERQKIMLKGSTLKDDGWGSMDVNDGSMFLMVGSRDALPIEPVEKPKFVEDMGDAEYNETLDLPTGLENLGNTCYLNAVLQCLKTVPELRTALRRYDGRVSYRLNLQESLTASIRDLYTTLDNSRKPLVPDGPLLILRTLAPRFAEKSNDRYCQQDANECWGEIMRVLLDKLPPLNDKGEVCERTEGGPKSIIDQFFGGTFVIELKCEESDEEPVTQSKENFLQLSCFITADVRYMVNGLLNKMQEKITKNSSILGKDAIFVRKTKISRLPAYLSIQYVRFYYKGREKLSAKVLRDIKFPIEFDAYDLCTEELQKKLMPARNKFKEAEEAEFADARSADKVTNINQQKETKEYDVMPFSFSDDIGSNNSGYYTLQAVVTHKGRCSTSGHYVGWVRSKDHWVKCDDDNVSPVTEDEILKLSGGGDWHCAYVLLYGPKILKMPKK